MDVKVKGGSATGVREEEMGIRKGPWTVEEDTILVNYVAVHGEGRWNSVARFAGLKRTGKSCRLRWLNYLRPDVRRGNITLQEQLLILDLHSRWGNRWSKIAQHLPGRTDNEIKNYWRTRVIKQAKQLNCDVNSKQFRDAMRYVWMPRLLERIKAASQPITSAHKQFDSTGLQLHHQQYTATLNPNYACGNLSVSESSAEIHVPSNSDYSESCEFSGHHVSDGQENGSDLSLSFHSQQGGGDSLENLWNDENMWFLQQQLCDEL
ncbi:hypothetical protein L6164_034812 [Bauhinia variegata]|uniref:Uncharacterized protein n=1 Tax=Bauhinia variegata TaxID=167791 RepID=A0ACB9KWM3_BAUVA|nr:hypothetical protein L6164_034812 [Bauhinia variegata]